MSFTRKDVEKRAKDFHYIADLLHLSNKNKQYLIKMYTFIYTGGQMSEDDFCNHILNDDLLDFAECIYKFHFQAQI